MGTPSGMRCTTFSLENGDKVLVYSDSSHIFLQLRHSTPTGPTEQDILTPSFKVAVALHEGAALALASELVSIVATRLKAPLTRRDEEAE
jgi:hypothetical protein